MRQPLETHVRGRRHRIGIIPEHVAPADLDRVHADFGGRHIHQAFGDRDRDRMADCPVLAGRRLVLEDDRGPGPVILEVIGATAEVHHLVAFDGGGARIDRIWADRRPVIDIHGEDPAVFSNCNPRVSPS